MLRCHFQSRGGGRQWLQRQRGMKDGGTRVYINSLGEGAVWVLDTNCSRKSVNHITTSGILPGYDQHQRDDVLHNHTVAKITLDCGLNPVLAPVQRIVSRVATVTEYVITLISI